MASTTFGKPSGASVAALLLLVAVLAGSFAPGAQAQVFNLTIENKRPNTINFTIVPGPEIPGRQGPSFLVPAGGSVTRTLTTTREPARLVSSDTFLVKVLGGPPYGGKTYATNGDTISKGVAVTGLKVKIVRYCVDVDTGKPGLTFETYSMLPEVLLSSICALLQQN